MKNLAGSPEATETAKIELCAAGIEPVTTDPGRREVPSKIAGRLGAFTFTRAWYYWVAEGPMPLEAARSLYAHPVGRADVRVAGHCGCPAPDEWVTWRDGAPVVDAYHIDSLEGLRLFADTVRCLGGRQ